MKAREATTAIVFVGSGQASGELSLTTARALLPLGDRPLLQCVVEALVKQGCANIHVFLDEHPEDIRAFLGSGERWGIDITCHYLDRGRSLAGNLKRLALGADDLYWLASSETLPGELIETIRPTADSQCVYEFSGTRNWSGWGLFFGSSLGAFEHVHDLEELSSAIFSLPGVQRISIKKPIDARNDRNYLTSSRHWLRQHYGTKVKLGRGARVHPEAVIHGPVYIGINARIGAGAEVGPNVVIGHDAVVDRHAEIVECVVLPETYVGQGLYLEEAIVAPHRLASVKNDTVVESIEAHLIASVRPQWKLSRPAPAIALLRILLWPLYVLGRPILRRYGHRERKAGLLRIFVPAYAGHALRKTTLPLPHPSRSTRSGGHGFWLEHFINTFYPGLRQVRMGKIELFGLELRDVSEVSILPEHWQALYYEHPCGLLNENVVNLDAPHDSGLRYANDVCAAAGLVPRTRLRILRTYIGLVLGDITGILRPEKLAARN